MTKPGGENREETKAGRVSNPHDALFKKAFGEVESSREFFRGFLPDKMVAALDLERLQIEKDSFVDEQLRQRQSDMLFRTFTKGEEEAWIYLLFEHQSTPEPDMPFRLWRYLTRIWEQHQAQYPKEHSLPLILPMVLYHGESPWNVPQFFSESLSFRGRLGIHPPELEYVLFDLGEIPDEWIKERIKGCVEVHLALALMKHIRDRDFLRPFETLIPLILELAMRRTGLEYIESYLHYVYYTRSGADYKNVVDLLHRTESEAKGGTVTTIAEHLIEEGRQEGKREGKREGKQEGKLSVAREVLLEILQEEFGNLPPTLNEKLFHVQDHQVLLALRRQLKTCKTLKDFENLVEKNSE